MADACDRACTVANLGRCKGEPAGSGLASELLMHSVWMPALWKLWQKSEFDFDPNQRTGSYIGLFQLSRSEFRKYGSGDITSARDNAVAAAYKFVIEATLFEEYTHRKPTINDLYLIHQQGWRGAAEHVSHPERIAWKSMCATEEGRRKGARWRKRAIWRRRVDQLHSRYSETAVALNEAP